MKVDPMHILYVVPGSREGSDMIFVKRQIAELKNRGVRVDVFFFPIWSSLPSLLEAYLRLVSFIREKKPDLVHAHYGTMTGIVCAFGTIKSIVITFRGGDLHPSLRVNPLRIRVGHVMSQIAALRACKIICVTEDLRRRLWWKKKAVDIIPSPVDLSLFKPIAKEDARKKLGFGTDVRIVLFNAGRDPIQKGIEIVRQAVSAAEKYVKGIHLVVFEGNVNPDKMPLYYNAADCLLFASKWTGSPNVIKEALACNLPIVSTRAGDVEERLRGVFPSEIVLRDPISMGKALANILAVPERSNGREKVKKLSLDSTIDKMIQLYSGLINAH